MGDELRERKEVGQGFTQCCDTKQFRKKVPWLRRREDITVLVRFRPDLDQIFVSNYN